MKFLATKEWKQLRSQHLAKECCCVLCGSSEKLSVHHILYRRFYSKHKLAAWNLATLCKSCHYTVHKSSWGLKLAEWLRKHRPRDWKKIMANV